ncbi:hypothetical protein A3E49_02575 [Candidatus Saccharibacteria bacterium RIFCSPHIGHO2_12_FULL_49_19]|nr:MAG: hypothetical protein A3E49_02575 [Candidatus Saccharibacteria bacterium RIFCSPHIGHO2_12_FULL_49_19]
MKFKKAVMLGMGAAANPRRTARRVKFHRRRRQVNRNRRTSYQNWFKEYEKSANEHQEQAKAVATFGKKPLISIILPIYNTNHLHLRQCIQSVIDQSYDNWELCVADDASTTNPLAVVKELGAGSGKIKWVRSDKNQHIAGASNEALKLASGEHIALLDHDDLLLPNALFEAVQAINENPKSDLIYSDEDKVEDGKGHSDPFFKPDWSPDFLKSCNYVTHFAVMRRSTVEAIGGFRIGTEGAQDWDLFLRLTAKTKNIYHIPKVLYSWRKSPTSTAKTAKSKPYAYINQLRVLRDALSAKKQPYSVLESRYKGFWRINYHIQGSPLVSIIIPTKDNYRHIKTCLESIIENTTYPNFEVIIVDTGSKDKQTLDFYKSRLVSANPVKVVGWKKTFNFSGACNLGASKSRGQYLLFLNDDTSVITHKWIENMLEHAQRDEIGMVGCKLLFPNDHIQHAGVILSERDIAFHPFYGLDPGLDIFSNIFISNIRNCSAVTAACSMISRQKFEKVGGFDEALAVTYNDVDLCLRLLKAGYFNLYTPYAEVYHYESASVGKITTPDRDKKELLAAQELMRERWLELLKRDPFYNDNFIQHGPGYQLKTV